MGWDALVVWCWSSTGAPSSHGHPSESSLTCLISLTVCTEAVILSRGEAISHKVRMEIPHQSVRSEARDEH
jgi:hypothetical protein